MLESKVILITELNPEPWTVGTVTTGFKGKQRYGKIAKDQRLIDYQTGVAACIRQAYPGLEMFPTTLKLNLMFKLWRQEDEYTTGVGRKSKRKVADATNMQKALEDALQGVLYADDSQVKNVSTEIIAEGPDVQPLILIQAREYVPDPSWQRLADSFARNPRVTPPGNVYYTRYLENS